MLAAAFVVAVASARGLRSPGPPHGDALHGGIGPAGDEVGCRIEVDEPAVSTSVKRLAQRGPALGWPSCSQFLAPTSSGWIACSTGSFSIRAEVSRRVNAMPEERREIHRRWLKQWWRRIGDWPGSPARGIPAMGRLGAQRCFSWRRTSPGEL